MEMWFQLVDVCGAPKYQTYAVHELTEDSTVDTFPYVIKLTHRDGRLTSFKTCANIITSAKLCTELLKFSHVWVFSLCEYYVAMEARTLLLSIVIGPALHKE